MNSRMIRTLTAGFLFLTASLAQAGVDIVRWTAPSGARVFFVETHGLPILDVRIDFSAGQALDPPEKAGLASMTLALMDTGIEGMDETEIAERLADLGANISGTVDRDRASISLRTLSEESKRVPALDLMKAILSAPLFPEEVLAREKARSIAGLRESLTRPATLAHRAFLSALYPSHPYGRHATPESLETLQRADLGEFHARFYSARRAVITLVGDISRAQAEALAQHLTANLPESRLPEPGPLKAPELPSSAEQRVSHPASQAHVLMGQPALSHGDPDFFPLTVGNYILGGGGFTSRLMREIRDKRGYAYSVYSAFSPMKHPGPFQIGLQTKKEQAEEALALTREVLARFLAEGPTATELKAAKRHLTGSFPLRLDSNRKILESVAVIGFFDYPIDYLDRYAENIDKVTADQIRAAFARHIQPEALITIIVASH